MGPLQFVSCEQCSNDRDGVWVRVWTWRGDEPLISDLSWSLAQRLVPRLLARYGVVGRLPGMWGTPIFIR